MKICRIFCVILLAIALLPGSAPWAQGEDMFIVVGGSGLLGNSRQICDLYYDTATGDWVQILPDGTTKTFTWGNGKSFVMTYLTVRFYAETPGSYPYRLFLKAPNATRLWINNLQNVMYPGSSTVWGGANTETVSPGIVMTVKPSIEVRQLPQPPADPNSGPVQAGTVYMRITGYTVP